MGMMIFRPGQRLVIPGVQVFQPRVASAASTWWDNNGAISGCVAAYAAKGAADLAASYINLANPGTYNAVPIVAPTWNATDGWIFNGSTQYLSTQITSPGITWSVLIRFSNFTHTTNKVFFGTYTGPTVNFLLQTGVNGFASYNGGVSASNTPAISSGVLGFAGKQPYRNGVAEASTIPAGGTAPAGIVYINGFNAGSQLMAAYFQAFAIYNVTLTSGQVATITTAMQAL